MLNPLIVAQGPVFQGPGFQARALLIDQGPVDPRYTATIQVTPPQGETAFESEIDFVTSDETLAWRAFADRVLDVAEWAEGNLEKIDSN